MGLLLSSAKNEQEKCEVLIVQFLERGMIKSLSA